MDGWMSRSFADVVSLQRGHDLPTHTRVHGAIPIIGSFGVTGWHNEARYQGPGIAIGRSGASIGKATWVDGEFWPLNTCLFVVDLKGNDPRWVFRLLDQTDFLSFNSGSAQPSLNRNFLRSIPVWVPPLWEQRAIAEVLGALDDKIAANVRIMGAVDAFLSSRFETLAQGVPSTTLGRIACVNVAVAKPVLGGQLRYLDIASVSEGRYDWPELSDWNGAPGRARRVLSIGDTVWSTVRPNRRSHALVLDDDASLVGSTGLAVITPRQGLVAGVFEASRRDAFSSHLVAVAEGSAYPAVRADRFLDAPVPELDADSWLAFEALARPLRDRGHTAAKETRYLSHTRDSLLPLLMSGKLRVKDVEHEIAEVV